VNCEVAPSAGARAVDRAVPLVVGVRRGAPRTPRLLEGRVVEGGQLAGGGRLVLGQGLRPLGTFRVRL
jgi:hypothetical protein